jgi:hypothetical protein
MPIPRIDESAPAARWFAAIRRSEVPDAPSFLA